MEGGIPVLVVSDLEMLSDILIKKFNCFHARKGGSKGIHMFLANGLRWKRLRSISAPAFSTVRLKQVYTLDSDQTIMKKLFPEVGQKMFMENNALSYAIYELARHPEIQEKLRSEIMDYHKNEKPSYESVQRMVYLDCVIRETLRLYPVASGVVNRRCMQTCTTGGFTIEKGMNVVVDVWSIHYNKDIWGPDADEFVPEHQLDSLHPLAWIPFGAGPRRCIGERFALLEMKLTLARLLRKYRIFINDQTEVPLKLQEGMTNTPRNGVVLSLKLI
ncbi:p450 domain containing protein [Trichuris trichiura]|uniref:p450 domain containing protein n=1 Tax=Trichuris trichiura TaxID=36087 RepID=A0A077ZA68_TRITR|nr:p450 domain containing protein [Trichuris trichiura]